MPVTPTARDSLLPRANCYAVPGIPGLLAGEYPGAPDRETALAKLQSFRSAGIGAFIDLTDEQDGLRNYAGLLAEVWPDAATRPLHFHHPVRDLDVPAHPGRMRAILDTIDTVLAQGHRAYVHCWGGVGRTGTVVGCALVRRGVEGGAALAQVQASFAATPKGRLTGRASPEMPAQERYVLTWWRHERRREPAMRTAPREPAVQAAQRAPAIHAAPGERPDGPLAGLLHALRLGDPVVHRGLAVVPLFGDLPRGPDYQTFGEALRAGTCRVTEVSEGGSVPQLLVANTGARPVFLLDGEELIGAKQNRIVNLSILVPAARDLPIPVSCVEQGRWHYRSREFAESPRTMYPSARAAKMAQVSASFERGGRHADQGAVWDEIAAKAARMAASSETSAMSEIFARHEGTIEEYVAPFAALPGQVGAVFVLGGRAVGLDLFDAPATLAAYLPKLVRGHALDALDASMGGAGATRPASGAVAVAEAQHVLEALAGCGAQAYPAVGLGQDLRLRGETIEGAALQVDGTFVHLGAFATGRPRRR